MKNFTFLMIFSLLALLASAQQATFDWVETELSDGNNLKGMTINDSVGMIAGYGNTFLKSVDYGTSWDTLKLFDPLFNLPDISIKGSVGYIVTAREKAYDAVPDVIASGVILKTTDGGETWETIVTPTIGNDDNPALSPSATLSYGLDFQSVETVNDSVAFCGLRWYEYSPTGKDGKEDHSGVFKTTDGGENWINVSGDLEGKTITTITFNGDNGFVGGLKMLFKASASSDTLKDIYNLFPNDGNVYFSDIEMIDDNEIYFSTVSDSILYSTDGGSSFNKFPGIKGGWDIFKVNDSTLVVGGSKNKSFVSTNYGQRGGA
jgi:photosystem II stability/assembly factor-like uncharacterized protein